MWAGFELQYRDIKPQIIIEELLFEKDDDFLNEYEVYCFNSKPNIFQKIVYSMPPKSTVYNKFFFISDIAFSTGFCKGEEKADKYMKQAVKLSKILSAGFKFVRVD